MTTTEERLANLQTACRDQSREIVRLEAQLDRLRAEHEELRTQAMRHGLAVDETSRADRAVVRLARKLRYAEAEIRRLRAALTSRHHPYDDGRPRPSKPPADPSPTTTGTMPCDREPHKEAAAPPPTRRKPYPIGTTCQRIVRHLEAVGQSSGGELCRALGISSGLLAYHVRHGLLTDHPVRRRTQGREHIYELRP